jgi:AcrR family transcriptional regulator
MTTAAKPRPTGRDEIRVAVLKAAGDHFARRGTAASLRDIADDANVNVGLIHRHFGNKSDLLRAVLRHQTQAGAAVIARAATPAAALHHIFEAGPGTSRYVRTVAWLLLEGGELASFQPEYPAIKAMRAMAHEGYSDGDYDLRLLAGLLIVYGWTVFGAQLLTAFGFPSEEHAAVRGRLAELLEGLVIAD